MLIVMENRLFIKYQYAKQMLGTELDILLHSFEIKHGYNPVEHVKSRLKSLTSIEKKLAKKGYAYTLENVERNIVDIVGFRIVVSFLSDVYDIVSLISHSPNIIVKERKDYIASPKDSGYSSYHLIVLVPIYLEQVVEYIPAEIQVRTVAMDFWASLDHKIRYKFKEDIPAEVQSEMESYAKDIQELDKKMYYLNQIMSKYQ